MAVARLSCSKAHITTIYNLFGKEYICDNTIGLCSIVIMIGIYRRVVPAITVDH